ncbi:MAG: GAF domain-containing protein [Myxococcales bacterium]|nr:GAF domain-containing protein [Myxococcales bacterium]
MSWRRRPLIAELRLNAHGSVAMLPSAGGRRAPVQLPSDGAELAPGVELGMLRATNLRTAPGDPTDRAARDRTERLLRLQSRLAASPDVRALLAALAEDLRHLVPARDRVSLAFVEPDAQSLRIYRVLPVWTDMPAELPRVRMEGTVVGDVARDGQPRVVADVRASDNLRFGHASHDGIRSTASVPVLVAGRVVGVMNVGSRAIGACHAGMIDGLRAVAVIAGQAVYAAERALNGTDQVGPVALAAAAPSEPVGDEWPTRDEHERRYLARVLQHTQCRVEGRNGAARLLDLEPSTLRSRMKRLGIDLHDARNPRKDLP